MRRVPVAATLATAAAAGLLAVVPAAAAAGTPVTTGAVTAGPVTAGPVTAGPLAAGPRTAAAATGCEPGNVQWTPQTPPALDMLQARLAWTVTRGAGVLVAVVDSGVDAANAHLTDALTGGVDLVGDGLGANGYADLHGHGTAVAGTIAAREHPGSGVVGLAPEARLFSVRVFASDDQKAREAGVGPDATRLADGIRAAADAGAQVVAVAMSSPDDTPALAEAVAYAAGRGALVVASGGNASTEEGTRYPAAAPGALGVTAVDAAGSPSLATHHGPHVRVAAPGQQVLTSAVAAGDCMYAQQEPRASFATGYAAGAAALVAAAHPDETPAQWAHRLEATAVRPDPDHRDDAIGWGVVQPYEAIVLVPDGSIRGPADPVTGAAPAPLRPEVAAPRVHRSQDPWGPVRGMGTVVTVLALSAVGVLGAVAVLRTRRHAPAVDPVGEPGDAARDEDADDAAR
ncbi:S8 family serine peptidase [Cellulomonas shaoxiangyii]|uniref:Peptidase S8 n=1 Tax=Cellulomonas shaoxiangyii TaxID=2566013 RepID=A0A4V1CMV3_9CELL|nr:S8 family serine peptidase [Cellulomonas shaoxiangyii]QCB94245.1 peptidase S8 [Cellulomonas shaoxiangyii]TGY78298.1 peptidase S8 [Cellulomonas shaoxiangyii]